MSTVTLSREEKHRLSAVLRSMDPTAPKENRRWLRHKVLFDLWIKKVSRRGKKALFKVLAINVSKRGVAIVSPQKLSIGERFVMPLRFDDGGGRLVLCQVRDCRTLPSGEHRVGAYFIEWIEDTTGTTPIPAAWMK